MRAVRDEEAAAERADPAVPSQGRHRALGQQALQAGKEGVVTGDHPHRWERRSFGLRTEEACARCGVTFGTPPAASPCNPAKWSPSAQIAALREQLGRYEKEMADRVAENATLRRSLEDQQTEIEQLQRALAKYGHHLSACESQYLGGSDDDCDCGFKLFMEREGE